MKILTKKPYIIILNRISIMKIILNNKSKNKYFFDYTFEAGLSLKGWEVKSIKKYKVNIEESYIKILKREFFLIDMFISINDNIKKNSILKSRRDIKLLLKNVEIKKIIIKVKKYNYFLIPINLHYRNNYIKLSFSLGKNRFKNNKKFIEKKNISKKIFF